MPITVTDSQGNVTIEHRGEVVDVKRFRATRNLSDTLDYTDIQTVDCCEALVYVGRVAGSFTQKVGGSYYKEGEVLAPIDRFRWVDCSNLFAWRGSPNRSPRIDDIRHPDVVIDLCEYVEARQQLDAETAERARKHAEAERVQKAEQERNRPVVGKQMVVKSGRKVRPGTQGTVAYVHSSGRVLLKDDSCWQDRRAQGQWVDGRHLAAR